MKAPVRSLPSIGVRYPAPPQRGAGALRTASIGLPPGLARLAAGADPPVHAVNRRVSRSSRAQMRSRQPPRQPPDSSSEDELPATSGGSPRRSHHRLRIITEEVNSREARSGRTGSSRPGSCPSPSAVQVFSKCRTTSLTLTVALSKNPITTRIGSNTRRTRSRRLPLVR